MSTLCRREVALVSMPFGPLERPALGLSLLKAALTEVGVITDVHYLTFRFAEFVGYDDYQWLSLVVPHTAFAGEWTFTGALYGDCAETDERYINEVLRDTWGFDDNSIRRVRRIRSFVSTFLDHCLEAVPWTRYTIVGFTSTFEQNVASLALAHRIKARFPHLTIVFGGANWEGEMGEALHSKFAFVDYACSAEAEESFPALVMRVFARQPVENPPIPGLVYRTAQG